MQIFLSDQNDEAAGKLDLLFLLAGRKGKVLRFIPNGYGFIFFYRFDDETVFAVDTIVHTWIVKDKRKLSEID